MDERQRLEVEFHFQLAQFFQHAMLAILNNDDELLDGLREEYAEMLAAYEESKKELG